MASSQSNTGHPVKDKSRFVLPKQVYNNPFTIQVTGMAIQVDQVCTGTVALGRDAAIVAEVFPVVTIRQMAWPPHVIEPCIVVRIIQAGDDRPP